MGQSKNLKHKDGFFILWMFVQVLLLLLLIHNFMTESWALLMIGQCSLVSGTFWLLSSGRKRRHAVHLCFLITAVRGRPVLPRTLVEKGSPCSQWKPALMNSICVGICSCVSSTSQKTPPNTFCFFELHVDLFYKRYVVIISTLRCVIS